MLRSVPCPCCFLALLFVFGLVVGTATSAFAQDGKQQPPQSPTQQRQQPTPVTASPQQAVDPVSLFDGKTMAGWEVTNFGGEGDCEVEDGCLIVRAGYPISGINSTRDDLPKTNYEISLDAKKADGIDFFCGLTFPVNDTHCTFIVGGWAGVVVGLSCIDDKDASDNDTRSLMKFEKDQWYKIKVKVEPKRIQCWIDDQRVVDQDLEGHKVSLRNETLPSRPLGICNFETTSHFKNIQLLDFGAAQQKSGSSQQGDSDQPKNSKTPEGSKTGGGQSDSHR